MALENYSKKQETDAVEQVLREPYHVSLHEILARYFLVIGFFAVLIMSPFAFGLLWFDITRDPLSGALIGIVTGAFFDFVLLLAFGGS